MTDHPGEWHAVDAWISELLLPDDPALEAALVASAEAGLPSIAVSAPQGQLLAILAASVGARRILEIGCLGGYSAIWMARALPTDGILLSLELDEKNAEVARKNIANAGLAKRVEVRVGAAADSMRSMIAKGEEPFDLIFIDADKGGYPEYLTLAMQLVRTGSLIIGDNATQRGAVVDSTSHGTDVVAIRRFTELLGADPRLEATIIQTVGTKGLDGLAIARVTRT